MVVWSSLFSNNCTNKQQWPRRRTTVTFSEILVSRLCIAPGAVRRRGGFFHGAEPDSPHSNPGKDRRVGCFKNWEFPKIKGAWILLFTQKGSPSFGNPQMCQWFNRPKYLFVEHFEVSQGLFRSELPDNRVADATFALRL